MRKEIEEWNNVGVRTKGGLLHKIQAKEKVTLFLFIYTFNILTGCVSIVKFEITTFMSIIL